MDIEITTCFSTGGAFYPVNSSNEVRWFDRNSWSNQYGNGGHFEFNLIWFHFSVHFTRDLKVKVTVDG